MATEEHHKENADIDLDESPFELQPIEGLPLTNVERADLKRLIETLDRERSA